MLITQILALGLGCVLVTGVFSASNSQSKYGDLGEDELLRDNPLKSCPDSPNCVRESREVKGSADEVFSTAKKVIKEMDGTITGYEEDYLIRSEFKAFVFTDDFDAAVATIPTDSSRSVLHLRSASRVGHSDLGVNPRRVNTFWEILSERLD